MIPFHEFKNNFFKKNDVIMQAQLLDKKVDPVIVIMQAQFMEKQDSLSLCRPCSRRRRWTLSSSPSKSWSRGSVTLSYSFAP